MIFNLHRQTLAPINILIQSRVYYINIIPDDDADGACSD